MVLAQEWETKDRESFNFHSFKTPLGSAVKMNLHIRDWWSQISFQLEQSEIVMSLTSKRNSICNNSGDAESDCDRLQQQENWNFNEFRQKVKQDV